jgi:hypothetical protein
LGGAYRGAIEVKTKSNTDALAETAKLLTQGDVILFEAAIAHEGFLVRVDVLVKRGDVLEAIGVKAKSYSGDPGRLSGKRKATCE